ncbi:MAG: nitroreductase family protein [Desulfuromonadaceae bacterium]|nr:nitroreductase family protein [Desulfuromonadaceae bacterium]
MTKVVEDCDFRKLIEKTRNYHYFVEAEKITEETLRELVNYARLAPSTSNLNQQPLRYVISADAERNAQIFDTLSWQGYLRGWGGPIKGVKPTGYIIILGDKTVCSSYVADQGIAAQSILLGATHLGLGGCIAAKVQRRKLREMLDLPTRYEILLVVAIGKPGEEIIIEAQEPGEDAYGWHDDSGNYHLPKRSLDSVILKY